MRPTMSQIAKDLGISRAAVSYALRDKPGITADLRRRVRERAEQLNYQPNAAAVATVRGRFGNVGLLTSSRQFRSHVPLELLYGLWSVLDENHLRLMFAQLPDEKLISEGFTPRILQELTVDGLLINYTDHVPERMVELLAKRNTPAIWLNSPRDQDSICPDDHLAGRLATEYLIELGHRDVAYVDFTHGYSDFAQAHYSIADRQRGYEDAMRDAGLRSRVVREDQGIDFSDRLSYSQAWLSQPGRPTAVVSYDVTSVSPILIAAERLGLTCPNDFSLIGLTQPRHTSHGHLCTTVPEPWYELGRAGVEALLSKFENANQPLAPVRIRPALAAGDTVGPPPSH